MTSREVAELAGVSVSAVQKAVRAGQLQARKPGHDLDIDEESARLWVASDRRRGPKAKSQPPVGGA